MNIRKPVDYTDLYAQLETALCRNKKQMDQYAAIGKAVALRSEKGAAVAAADYLREAYPELSGFSPRNLRRMRAFYQTYRDQHDLLELAMGLLEQEPEAMVLWGLTMDPEAFAASLSAPRPVTRSTLRAMSWNSALFANVYTQTYSLERIRAHGLRFDTAMGRGALIGEDHDFVTRYCALDRGGRDLPLLVIGAPLYYYAQENENSLMKQAARARSADSVALPPPEPRYCEVLLADMASTFPSMCDLGQEKALQDYLRHYLRCFAFGVWSARQLKEPLPRGFFRRPEIRRLLDLTKEQKVFSVYYLPFRLGLAGLCARLYAWDESHHINYWRFYEATHRLFFRGWKK